MHYIIMYKTIKSIISFPYCFLCWTGFITSPSKEFIRIFGPEIENEIKQYEAYFLAVKKYIDERDNLK